METLSKRDANIYNQLKLKYPGAIISPGYIRMENYLVNGKSEYEFFHKLLGTESITENKLNDQDAFRFTDIGVFLLAEKTAVKGVGVLQTYPNPFVFPDEAGFLQTEHLEHLYNGKFRAQVGTSTYIPSMPVLASRVVNIAQQTTLANRTEAKANDGFIAVTPQYTIKGRENNSLKLIVPGDSTQKVESNSPTSGSKSKVVLILKGFVINGAGNTSPNLG